MKKHGVVIDVESERFYFKKNHCQHGEASYVNSPTYLEMIDGDKTTPPVQKIENRSTNSTSSTSVPSHSIILKRINLIQTSHYKSENRNEDQKIGRRKFIKDIVLIEAAVYHLLIKQPGSEIFAIFMKNINDQSKKNLRAKNFFYIKRNLSAEYHDLVDVFSKKASDELSFHRKYDHKIKLLKRHADHDNSFIYKISKPKLKILKKYLKKNIKKKLIKACTFAYVFFVLFVIKLN